MQQRQLLPAQKVRGLKFFATANWLLKRQQGGKLKQQDGVLKRQVHGLKCYGTANRLLKRRQGGTRKRQQDGMLKRVRQAQNGLRQCAANGRTQPRALQGHQVCRARCLMASGIL